MATKSLDDEMRSLSFDENYLISAAIDFGTTFSGYAFSFKSKPNEIKMNKNWGAELGCDSYKAPTCVMTNPDGSFHSFGYAAEHEYNQLDPQEDEIGGPNGYNLYRHFKLLLHNQGVKISSTVVSTSGHVRPAVDIFTMVLEYLKKHMMDPIKKSLKVSPRTSDIRWVLTVPAIWNDESKGFMREAAYRAGLMSEKNSSRLVIALEPEAASIFCRSLEVNNFTCGNGDSTEGLTFRSGEKLLIIDAGGGTVDITAHDILIDGKVKEISPPSGGPWGGIKVDEKFIALLMKMFGTDFINKFKVDRSQQWVQFMTNFEKSKKALILDGKCSIKVPVPFSFEKDFLKLKQLDLEEFANKSKGKGISFSNGYIVLKHEMAKELFSESVTHVIDHVMGLLSQKRLEGLNYMLLVGGFGECRVLQEACQSVFSHKVKILVPVEAQLAIIRGAVLFGHNPLQVSSRIARHTYGIKIRSRFREGVHDPSKRFTNDEGMEMCRDIFKVLVTKGETIETGTTRMRNFTNRGKAKNRMKFRIFETDRPNVVYVDEPGLKQVGLACLDITTKSIVTRTTFGHTELLLEAWEEIKGDSNPMKITVDFLSE